MSKWCRSKSRVQVGPSKMRGWGWPGRKEQVGASAAGAGARAGACRPSMRGWLGRRSRSKSRVQVGLAR